MSALDASGLYGSPDGLRAVGFAFSIPPAASSVAAQEQISAAEFLASLNFQKGAITLPGGVASLDLPEGSMTNFNPGHRYGDFDASVDQGGGIRHRRARGR